LRFIKTVLGLNIYQLILLIFLLLLEVAQVVMDQAQVDMVLVAVAQVDIEHL
jgi:hypothetical protein